MTGKDTKLFKYDLIDVFVAVDSDSEENEKTSVFYAIKRQKKKKLNETAEKEV
jgi:hypothetical protein